MVESHVLEGIRTMRKIDPVTLQVALKEDYDAQRFLLTEIKPTTYYIDFCCCFSGPNQRDICRGWFQPGCRIFFDWSFSLTTSWNRHLHSSQGSRQQFGRYRLLLYSHVKAWWRTLRTFWSSASIVYLTLQKQSMRLWRSSYLGWISIQQEKVSILFLTLLRWTQSIRLKRLM